MEADAPLARAARHVVLHAITGEHAEAAVVHARRNRNLEHAFGLAKIAVNRFVEPDEGRDLVELPLGHFPDVLDRLDRGGILCHSRSFSCVDA